MPMNAIDDAELMRRALHLAQEALYRTSPNPRVGCVLFGRNGVVLGEGATQEAGGPHAEIVALNDAKQRGNDVRGATAYVTLEPCAHLGRTGPCCDALIGAGVGRVVAALEDPNPVVAGQGFQRLRAAGVDVSVGVGAKLSRELNLGFFSRILRKRPWVRTKIAVSFDGRTALENGVSKWITSSDARSDGHEWRARACAVLTGVGTVLADNPQLDVRYFETSRQPKLVLVDSLLRTPVNSSIFHADRQAIVYTVSVDEGKIKKFQDAGVVVVNTPVSQDGQVDLSFLMNDLAVNHEINELHVEAGQGLNTALLKAGLVDEVLAYIAPKLLGAGMEWASIGPFDSLDQAVAMEFHDVTTVGADLRILARLTGHEQF